MTTLREAAQQALEALEWISAQKTGGMIQRKATEPITALRAALAEPVQEPVAWMHTDAYNPKNRYLEWSENRRGYLGDWIKTPLYAAPPQRKPLTEEEIWELYYAILSAATALPSPAPSRPRMASHEP